MKKILVMGLPGSGKTYFAKSLKSNLETKCCNNNSLATVKWLNADNIRKEYNDWDFSTDGRIKQSIRMLNLANQSKEDFVICDFIAPLPKMRLIFNADWTIWMDTIDAGAYDDTNKLFIKPTLYHFRITEKNSNKWAPIIADRIIEEMINGAI